MKVIRVLPWVLLTLWALTALPILIGFALTGESLLPSAPVEAHDLPDLVVWAALTGWIYVVPLILFGVGVAVTRAAVGKRHAED